MVSQTAFECSFLYCYRKRKIKKLFKKGDWLDIVRLKNSSDKKLFSWWSYRSKDGKILIE